MDPALSDLFDDHSSLLRFGLIVERGPDGIVRANVKHMRLHSNDFECGYCGSGPADLALSVLNAIFPPSDGQLADVLGLVRAPADGRDRLAHQLELGWSRVPISALAFRLHHKFEQDFIAPMSEEGGVVKVEVIRDWIASHTDRQP